MVAYWIPIVTEMIGFWFFIFCQIFPSVECSLSELVLIPNYSTCYGLVKDHWSNAFSSHEIDDAHVFELFI